MKKYIVLFDGICSGEVQFEVPRDADYGDDFVDWDGSVYPIYVMAKDVECAKKYALSELEEEWCQHGNVKLPEMTIQTVHEIVK